MLQQFTGNAVGVKLVIGYLSDYRSKLLIEIKLVSGVLLDCINGSPD